MVKTSGVYDAIERRREIQKIADSKLERLAPGEVLEMGNLTESESNYFQTFYSEKGYAIVGSDIDTDNGWDDGLRFCLTLMRRSQDA